MNTLNENIIRNQLVSPLISEIIIFDEIPSTNLYLSQLSEKKAGIVCLADSQTAGRGRLGRTWISPHASNLYLSLLWSFEKITALSGLSLVVGISVAHALKDFDVKIKWPNDLIAQNKKLGGILIELQTFPQGVWTTLGIGLNVHMPKEAGELIQQPWIDLFSLSKTIPTRNELTAAILNTLIPNLELFKSQGLQGFLNAWQHLDFLFQKPITIKSANGSVEGISQGINAQGLLRVGTFAEEEQYFHEGDVSVRL